MARDVVIDKQIRDTNTYTFTVDNTNLDGTVVAQYVNDLDAEVTVDINGTYAGDTNFSDVANTASTTVGAGDNGKAATDEPWDRLVFSVVATNAPTSGSLTIKLHE